MIEARAVSKGGVSCGHTGSWLPKITLGPLTVSVYFCDRRILLQGIQMHTGQCWWVMGVDCQNASAQSFWPQAHTCDGNRPRESSLVSSAVEPWVGFQQESWTTEETGRGGNWAGLMDGGAWLAMVHGIERSQTQLKRLSMQHSSW